MNKNEVKEIAYDKNARIVIPTYDALFSMVQSYFRMYLNKKATILIVGAGGGNEINAWGSTNPGWLFDGLDPSKEMLDIARIKVKQLGLESKVNLIEGTIDNVSLSNTYDGASCILVLHFIHDQEEKLKLLTEVRKHLKPGAPFVLVSAFGDINSEDFNNNLNVRKSFLLNAGYDEEQAKKSVEGIKQISFITEKEIKDLLSEAGFTNITKFYETVLFGGWFCLVK